MRYVTVNEIRIIFTSVRKPGEPCTQRTIYRWVKDGKRIALNGIEYIPERDHVGHIRFRVVELI